MSLEDKLKDVHKEISISSPTHPVSPKMIIPLLDLTLLDDQASSNQINDLIIKANKHQVAAICVLPQHLHFIEFTAVKRATVVNFPTGNQSSEQVIKDIHQLVSNKETDEIDYVFPYQAYLQGQEYLALSSCQHAYQLCKRYNLIFKVILETGAFPSIGKVYQASVDIINGGCDFLKTSTGKISGGASIPAAFALISAIRDSNQSCGIKLSGGIKTVEQSLEYIQLAQHMMGKTVDKSWFRIGASNLLDEIIR